MLREPTLSSTCGRRCRTSTHGGCPAAARRAGPHRRVPLLDSPTDIDSPTGADLLARAVGKLGGMLVDGMLGAGETPMQVSRQAGGGATPRLAGDSAERGRLAPHQLRMREG